jgi:DNA-directed RNA polymerase specialized sigma24 family protein
MVSNEPLSVQEAKLQLIAAQLQTRYGWTLVETPELVRRAFGLLRHGQATAINEAVIGAYCVIWHTACSGDQGHERQNMAYTELGNYLLYLARQRYVQLSPGLLEDAVQSALERVFRHFARCKQPITFLAFASQQLLDSVRTVVRQSNAFGEPLEKAVGGFDEPSELPYIDPSPSPDERVLERQFFSGVDRLLSEFLKAHPRASQQVDVLRMTVLDGLDDVTIGAKLGMRPGSVQTARSRIRQTLIAEPYWRTRATQLGIVSDEV